MPSESLAATAADVLERVRQRTPLVHCITNTVAQAFTANVLLAFGAVPSMTISADEIAEFTARADALVVNLGTFDAARQKAIAIAVETAMGTAKPWVLDPVMIDRSSLRAGLAKILIARKPRAVRLNRAELGALAGGELDGAAVAAFARDNDTTIGLTGDTDLVFDSKRVASLFNGHPLMAKVTAMGCAASALVAACLAVETDPWLATVSALIILGVAGDIAGETAAGPGSFAVDIIDALHALDREALLTRGQVVA